MLDLEDVYFLVQVVDRGTFTAVLPAVRSFIDVLAAEVATSTADTPLPDK